LNILTARQLAARLRSTMNKTFLLLIFAASLISAGGQGVIPVDLAGEWAQSSAEFTDGEISKGTALYVGTNGFVAIITTPPPIGEKGSGSYSPKRRVLTVTMTDDNKSTRKYEFAYDPKGKTFKSREGHFRNEKFTRRRDKIPKHVLEEFE